MFSHFEKLKNHLVFCSTSQLQYKEENQHFISNFIFQCIKEMERHFRYTNLHGLVWLFFVES